MLKLYGGARSRASIVQWYLEELAIPYEFVLLDVQAGEHRQPEFWQSILLARCLLSATGTSDSGSQAQFCSI
nr:hypothetical protein [Leptolyngbya sp. FACHB-261]